MIDPRQGAARHQPLLLSELQRGLSPSSGVAREEKNT